MSAGRRRLMAVHAHPDDESSKGAATTARYAAEGVDVLVVTCTGGERGDLLNPHYPPVEPGLDVMREVRRHEMAAAAEALGVRQHWLGFVDSGLPEGDPLPPLPEGSFATFPLEVVSAPLVELVRSFRPHVMTTYDPTGGYPHPDHIMCHRIAFEAFHAAGDPERYRGLGDPWQPLKLYYNHGFSLVRMRAVHEAVLARGGESPFGDWIESREAREIPERTTTTSIECSAYFPQRDAALRAHATQIDPNGFFFAIPRDLEVQSWPTEEYELAVSHVPTSLPESDLFAGVEVETDDVPDGTGGPALVTAAVAGDRGVSGGVSADGVPGDAVAGGGAVPGGAVPDGAVPDGVLDGVLDGSGAGAGAAAAGEDVR